MPGIFISYRRNDNPEAARRIYLNLKNNFAGKYWLGIGPKRYHIFFDILSIEAGDEFRSEIEDSIRESDVFIPVIGERWLEKEKSGKSRIENDDDFVRFEISEALNKGCRVIPITVDGVSMPDRGDLPDDIKPLTERNEVKTDPKKAFDFERQMAAVRSKIRKTVRWKVFGIEAVAWVGMATIVAFVGASLLFTGREIVRAVEKTVTLNVDDRYGSYHFLNLSSFDEVCDEGAGESGAGNPTELTGDAAATVGDPELDAVPEARPCGGGQAYEFRLNDVRILPGREIPVLDASNRIDVFVIEGDGAPVRLVPANDVSLPLDDEGRLPPPWTVSLQGEDARYTLEVDLIEKHEYEVALEKLNIKNDGDTAPFGDGDFEWMFVANGESFFASSGFQYERGPGLIDVADIGVPYRRTLMLSEDDSITIIGRIIDNDDHDADDVNEYRLEIPLRNVDNQEFLIAPIKDWDQKKKEFEKLDVEVEVEVRVTRL